MKGLAWTRGRATRARDSSRGLVTKPAPSRLAPAPRERLRVYAPVVLVHAFQNPQFVFHGHRSSPLNLVVQCVLCQRLLPLPASKRYFKRERVVRRLRVRRAATRESWNAAPDLTLRCAGCRQVAVCGAPVASTCLVDLSFIWSGRYNSSCLRNLVQPVRHLLRSNSISLGYRAWQCFTTDLASAVPVGETVSDLPKIVKRPLSTRLCVRLQVSFCLRKKIDVILPATQDSFET